MLQHKHLRQMAGILLLMAVVTLSCQFGPTATTSRQITGGEQAIQPVATQQPTVEPTNTATVAILTATATTAPTKAIEAIAADKIDITSVTSGADGAAQFANPLGGAPLAVSLENNDSHQPVGNMSLWFASRGTEVLVMAIDPAGGYVPQLQTMSYQDAQNAALADKISLTPLSTATKSPEAWAAYLKSLPDLSAWETGAQELCAPPENLKAKLPFQADGLLLGRPDDQMIAEWVSLPYYLGVGSAGLLPSAFPTQAPAIPRWRISRIGANGPAVATPTGFCLPPLDRKNDQAVITWANYGLQNKDVYPFIKLAAGTYVSYVNSPEGAQINLSGDFLGDLDRHLANGAQCDGYGFASDYLQIWTSGWNPTWEIKQMCYLDGCKAVDPPVTSDIAAFFFVKDDYGWSLTSVWQNKPDLWKDVYQLTLTACPAATP